MRWPLPLRALCQCAKTALESPLLMRRAAIVGSPLSRRRRQLRNGTAAKSRRKGFDQRDSQQVNVAPPQPVRATQTRLAATQLGRNRLNSIGSQRVVWLAAPSATEAARLHTHTKSGLRAREREEAELATPFVSSCEPLGIRFESRRRLQLSSEKEVC